MTKTASRKHFFIIILLLIFTVSLAISAYAALYVSEGEWMEFSYGGKNYENRNVLQVSTSYGPSAMHSVIYISGDVPAGYMGVRAILYNDDDEAKVLSDTKYNSSATNLLSIFSDYYKVVDNYYSKGYALGWKGTDYGMAVAGRAPYLSYTG